MKEVPLLSTESKPSSLLCSSSTGLSLENRILTQTSPLILHLHSSTTDLPILNPLCSALCPSSLSSTSSTSPLLSTSSSLLSTSLISTENIQLKHKPLIASSLCSPYPLCPLIRSVVPLPGLGLTVNDDAPREQMSGDGEEETEGVSNSTEESCNDEQSECSNHDDQMEVDDCSPTEMSALDLMLSDNAENHILNHEDDFGLFESGSDKSAELLKNMKYMLLNSVCCSLVNKCSPPRKDDLDSSSNVWLDIKNLAEKITLSDHEFLLKVAVYTRQELNIRITANFLLALAAFLPNSKSHLRRYFCAAVQLPSDWLEVTRLYSTCFSKSLPSCLKKALADKFKEFSEYQLAKYNTRKLRGKHKKKHTQPVSSEEWKIWANLCYSDEEHFKNYVKMNVRLAADKKQNEFNMKKLIKRLHIKQPAEFVMSILGKRYPADVRSFWRSGLSGVWQSERANERMKLKQPETWETRLSLEGNNAATWEKLIDNNSLPFMAMLRNLRNMITQGISAKHHDKIIKRLTNKSAVIKSRQFPFRFLSAYKVIVELKKLIDGTVRADMSRKSILQGILEKIPKSNQFKGRDWETTGRKRLRATLRVPFVRHHYRLKCKTSQISSQKKYSEELLLCYCQALEKAVQISCKYNIPPLSGHTLIFFVNYWRLKNCKGIDFCLPSEVSDGNSTTASADEAGMLLSMMIKSSCEHAQFFLVDYEGIQELQLESENLLENVKFAMQKIKDFPDSTQKIIHSNFFFNLLEEKTKVDNIIVIDESAGDWKMSMCLQRYRKECISLPLMVSILTCAGNRYTAPHSDPKSVNLYGFSEQILRFVAERGSSRLLDHVEHIDKLHNIPPPAGNATKIEKTPDVVSLPAVPKLRWRGVRVFISSTFRDMHSERDVLVRSVFPELRRRAASLCLHLQEVDLRWGVTEDESARATEICLNEVCRSQVLLGILGERYGLVPPRPQLPALPQYSWLSSAPDGLSITEMEIRQFQHMFCDSAQSRMFFYFRSPHLVSFVPEAWRDDFAAESAETASKMNDLKSRIQSSGFKVTENYPCDWGGVVDGKPFVKGLEMFAKSVIEDLWATLQILFAEESDEADLTIEIKEQEVHQDAQRRQFYGRAKLLSVAKEKVLDCQRNGGVLLVEGVAGAGKTAFMAALAHALQTPDKLKTVPVCDVISYSTAASQSASGVEPLLRCLNQWLRRRKEQKEEQFSDTTYRALLSEWTCRVRELKKGQSLAILVDGADLVHDAKGQGISEWIPEHLPKGVCLVLSVSIDSPLRNSISNKKNSILFPLKALPLPDRREIVQKELSVYGKKLSDSAFNNQLQTLLMKKGAVSPLYLHLACEELRSYASFEKMKENLQALPITLGELVQHSLIRLQSEYGGVGLEWALAALTISSSGLKERDLYVLLNLCTDLSSTKFPITWSKALKLAKHPRSRVPMATFSQLARSIQGLIGSPLSLEPDEPLLLTNPDVRSAFEQLFVSVPEDRTRAHMILAAYLWVRSDPHGKDTFLHCDAETLTQLPLHLMQCDQWQILGFLLCSYNFIYANVRHGLLHQLLENYSVFEETANSTENSDELHYCWAFVKRHAPLLSVWPNLFIQQALNEPCDSAAHTWAKATVEEGHVRAVKWLNNSGDLDEEGELVSTFHRTPSCVALSPAGGYLVVGTEQGSLHLIHTQTYQEIKALVSNCDGISGCVFVDDRVLWTTSYDGQVEVWDVTIGCRTAQLKAHSNRITGCDVSPDRKHFATVSLDFSLKVWASRNSTQVVSLQSPSPLNCVTFNPEGSLLAVGCWDGRVQLWDWIKQENLVTLSGHRCSVRSVSFAPSSSSLSLLCSGDLDGEIRLWSVPGSSCVWHFQAHRGSTEALHFLRDGEALLSAGHDGTVQLWSGGLGHSISVLGEEKKLLKAKASTDMMCEDAALCVAVNQHYAAVGYHGNGLKLYDIQSGGCVWTTQNLRVSISCLLWLQVKGKDFLLSGGLDQHLRLWVKQEGNEEILTMRGVFGVQKGAILALDQSFTYVASASDDFTIALWVKRELMTDSWLEPRAPIVLRGHNGGVTCLSFSQDGNQLLSGGKDQALMVWKVNSSPPVLIHTISHGHGDWITGCAWTPSAVMSCSNDCRLRLWDIQTGNCIQEVPTTSALSTLCCWEEYVMLGSADGLLTVWKSDLGVIAEIKAHHSRLHHTTVISNPDENQKREDLLIATASEDGTVKLWHPLRVQHRSTLFGHSGGVQALVGGNGAQFLTVSEDHSLRAWSLNTDKPARQMECVRVLCFLQTEVENVLICGYSSGRLELWQNYSLLYSDMVSESCICAAAGMPDDQVALGFSDCTVSVWKLQRDSQRCITSLSKQKIFTLKNSVKFLHYYTTLLGVSNNSIIIDIFSTDKDESKTINKWQDYLRVFAVDKDEENRLRLVAGENDNEIHIGILKCVEPDDELESGFDTSQIEHQEENYSEKGEEEVYKEQMPNTTAVSTHKDLIVCGDASGNIWFISSLSMPNWSPRRPAHSDRISALCLTDSTIISASYDKTVKLWNRATKKQVALFVCAAPLEVLTVNPNDPSQLVCGDTLGQIYFLSWKA